MKGAWSDSGYVKGNDKLEAFLDYVNKNDGHRNDQYDGKSYITIAEF